ncbi:SMAD/FHA domain-containing protein [Abortiporus biennis]|nr:SMAD/FHA domain-containing protein [Abortiporus biennis]
MVRDSRSPGPSNRSEQNGNARSSSYKYSSERRDKDRYDDCVDRKAGRGADEDYEYGRRRRGGGGYDRDSGYRQRDEGRSGGSSNYRRSDRERDNDRDYDRRRGEERERGGAMDSRGGSSRRSASPRNRSSRPRSHSRSKSPSQEEEDKAKPNFKPSGLLAAETKTVKNVDGTKTVLKYHEPPEARKPNVGWRLYVFKGKEQVDLLHIYRQSAYLFGRDKTVVDVPLDHPSCSKQHAVVQFRQVHEKNEFGDSKSVVKPFIIDLESTNGTHVNDEQIPVSRYYELKLGDVIKFGESQREYVLLSEDAA